MQTILDKAIETYRRDQFLRDANLDYAALRRKPKAWKQELAERELWDAALRDGVAE